MELCVLERTTSRLLGDGWFFCWGLPSLAIRRHLLLHNFLCQCPDLFGVRTYVLHRLLKYLFPNTQGRPLPRRNSDTNARHLVFPQVAHPSLHDDRVCIPCLDDPLVYASFEILLAFFMDKWSSEYGPHRALRWERYRTCGRDTQRARCMSGEMRKEVEWVVVVRPQVNLGDRNVVCTRNCRWRVQGAAGDDHGGNVGLGQHDGCCIVFVRRCGSVKGSAWLCGTRKELRTEVYCWHVAPIAPVGSTTFLRNEPT